MAPFTQPTTLYRQNCNIMQLDKSHNGSLKHDGLTQLQCHVGCLCDNCQGDLFLFAIIVSPIISGVRNPRQCGKDLNKAVESRNLSEVNLTKQLTCLELDLSSLTSVRRFARQILAKDQPIHVLVNNGECVGGRIIALRI